MELLRIVAMFFIVVFHCAYKSSIPCDSLTINTFCVKAMWYLGELGVNLFMLVTGYFMVTGSFKGRKLILLVCQVLFYWWLCVAIGSALGIYTFPEAKNNAILQLFPILTGKYWYVTAYVVIYILSPWINRFIQCVSQRSLLSFLLVMFLLYSVVPTLFGLLGVKVEGMLFYTRLIWLFIIYIAGAYLRLYPLKTFSNWRIPAIVSSVCILIMLITIVAIATHPTFFAKLGVTEWTYFWPPNTIPMAILSVGVFGLFLNFNIPNNRFINRIASTTLGIYLLHDSVLQSYIWRGGYSMRHLL
nr:acyltransferase [Adlercreutzia sp. ZJ154]